MITLSKRRINWKKLFNETCGKSKENFKEMLLNDDELLWEFGKYIIPRSYKVDDLYFYVASSRFFSTYFGRNNYVPVLEACYNSPNFAFDKSFVRFYGHNNLVSYSYDELVEEFKVNVNRLIEAYESYCNEEEGK